MSLSREYWTELYERQGVFYVAKRPTQESYDAQLAALAPIIRPLLPIGGRVLDFGCGPQRFRGVIEGEGREYVGVDLVPGLGTVEDDRDLPLGFDCAVAIFVLQHILDDAEYGSILQRLHRLLGPDGRLIVVDHQPMQNPDPHMAPRGPLAAIEAWPSGGLHVLGVEYDGHWVGYLDKAKPPKKGER